VAVDFPRLNIVLATAAAGHGTNMPYLWRAPGGTCSWKYRYSASSPVGILPAVAHIPDKVIFGSDWPTVPPLKEIVEGVAGLKLPDGALEKIFWGMQPGFSS